MALNSSFSSSALLSSISFNIRNPQKSHLSPHHHVIFNKTHKSSVPKARLVVLRGESISVQQLEKPLIEYMSLPASQYSVLDAERIERVDENTFRCYVYKFKFFALEVCPVLMVRVEEQPNGCCINLLSCKLEGSPVVVAQNEKFDASMMNKISCNTNHSDSSVSVLSSDTVIEVSINIPFPFRPIPVQAMESSGTQVLQQILRVIMGLFGYIF